MDSRTVVVVRCTFAASLYVQPESGRMCCRKTLWQNISVMMTFTNPSIGSFWLNSPFLSTEPERQDSQTWTFSENVCQSLGPPIICWIMAWIDLSSGLLQSYIAHLTTDQILQYVGIFSSTTSPFPTDFRTLFGNWDNASIAKWMIPKRWIV